MFELLALIGLAIVVVVLLGWIRGHSWSMACQYDKVDYASPDEPAVDQLVFANPWSAWLKMHSIRLARTNKTAIFRQMCGSERAVVYAVLVRVSTGPRANQVVERWSAGELRLSLEMKAWLQLWADEPWGGDCSLAAQTKPFQLSASDRAKPQMDLLLPVWALSALLGAAIFMRVNPNAAPTHVQYQSLEMCKWSALMLAAIGVGMIGLDLIDWLRAYSRQQAA